MWASIASTAISAVGSFFSLFGDLFRWAGWWMVYRLGAVKGADKAKGVALKIRDNQLVIMFRPALHRRALLDRMSKRKRDE